MRRLEVVGESNSEVTVTIKLPQLHYLNQFIRLKCAPSILGLFPNVKEITESMTAFSAVRRYFGFKNFARRDVILLDIACGHTPRTASLFAHMTRWNCIAIDPVLRDKKVESNRLALFAEKFEQFEQRHNSCVVALAVHAHIKLDLVLRQVLAPRIIIVAMPCCKELRLSSHDPVEEYEDLGCLSPKRTLRIYDIRKENY
jgi:hypothetical protein